MIASRSVRRPWGTLCLLMAALCVMATAEGSWRVPWAGSAEMSGAATPLIGKLEGPEIITDPAQFPTSFNEAPALAEMIKAGMLPPVSERLGADPLVVKPLHEVGRYGGTWRRGVTGPAAVPVSHTAAA
jgi:hypothetical protein